jgi:hypothetical protein
MRINKCYLMHYGAYSFSLGEMKTKKLVLSFCALAAVTGTAAQRAAATDAVPPVVDGAEPLSASMSEEQIEAAAVDEAEPASAPMSEEQIETVKQELTQRIAKEQTEFARMRKAELTCVEELLLYDHCAHFLLGRAAIKLYERICEMRRDITKAKERAQRAWLPSTKRRMNAIVEKLESDLANALEHMTNEHSVQSIIANNCMDKAEQLRQKAKEWREKRLTYFTELVEAYNNSGNFYFSISQDLEEMYVVALDGIFLAEAAIATSITDSISSHTDERWSRYMIWTYDDECRDVRDFSLCEDLQKMYKPALGYDHADWNRFAEQYELLDGQ